MNHRDNVGQLVMLDVTRKDKFRPTAKFMASQSLLDYFAIQ